MWKEWKKDGMWPEMENKQTKHKETIQGRIQDFS